MEIMNYKELINNAELIASLSQKTINCSQDYVEDTKDDIVCKMMDYIYLQMSDLMNSSLLNDSEFRRHWSNKYISMGSYGGDGTGAKIQFFLCPMSGNTIRVFMNSAGWWVSNDSHCTDVTVSALMNHWQYIKDGLNKSIQESIKYYNLENKSKVDKQLKYHEAVKNFKI